MSTPGTLRRHNLRSLGLTPSQLEQAGVGRYSYCRDLLEDPSKSFGEKVARKVEELLRLPGGWLDTVHGREEAPALPVLPAEVKPVASGYVRLPVLAEAAAGPGRVAQHEIELVEHVDVSEDWVRRTLRANPRALSVLTARGHSMRGIIEDGDVLFVEPVDRFRDDGIYVIAVGDLLRVKRLRLSVLDRTLLIESNDGSPAEVIAQSQASEALQVLGRVVGAWSLKRI
jgi:SOS-response transcriptional repressor LexA